MTKGKFLGHITKSGIEANPEKIKSILDTTTPKTIKDVQSLNGKLVALGRFLAKSAEKAIPFYQAFKQHTGKGRIAWTIEAEEALLNLKKHVHSLPSLTSPISGEPLIIYLYTNKEAISAVLLA